MGLILYQIRLGLEPFSQFYDIDKFMNYIKHLDLEEIKRMFEKDPNYDGLKDLNIAMLHPDPELRPTQEECNEIFEQAIKNTLGDTCKIYLIVVFTWTTMDHMVHFCPCPATPLQ